MSVENDYRDKGGAQDLFSKLEYVDREVRRPIPDWARQFIEIGFQISREAPLLTNKLTVCIVVPTRTYAAALIAAGIVRGAYSAKPRTSDHFARLLELPAYTPLYRVDRKSGLFYRALVSHAEIVRGERGLWIAVQEGKRGNGRVHALIRENQANDIFVSDKMHQLVQNPKGEPIRGNIAFLRGLYDEVEAYGLVLTSDRQLVVVSNKTRLQGELSLPTLTWRGRRSEGTFLDLIRPRGLAGWTETFRSIVISAMYDPHELSEDDLEVPFVVFDGAISYLRGNATWRQSHSIVILDRTEPSFESAVEDIRHRFIYRVDSSGLEQLVAPHGTDLVMFEEAS